MNNVDKKFEVYSDLDGWQAPGGGTIPPALCVTNLKPDIVIMDEHTKTLHIYELMMPLINNIEKRHTEKTQKYTPFISDITGYSCNLQCLEITSTGVINGRNKSTLHSLHKFMRKDLLKSAFLDNLNALAWYGSYFLWTTQEDPQFTPPPYLLAHLGGVHNLQPQKSPTPQPVSL